MQRREKEEEKAKTTPEKGAQKVAGLLEKGAGGDVGIEQLRKLL